MRKRLVRDRMSVRLSLRKGESIRVISSQKEFGQLLLAQFEDEQSRFKELLRSGDVEKITRKGVDLLEIMLVIMDEFASIGSSDFLHEAELIRRFSGSYVSGLVLESKK